MNPFFYCFLILTGWPVFYLIFRTKVIYETPRRKKRYFTSNTIVISNHTSIFDYVALMMVIVPRFPYTLGAEILYEKNFLFTFLLNCLGVIKVDRVTHESKALNKAIDVLKRGKLIYMFPEGRLPLPEEHGKLLPFNAGFAYMALKTGAKIVPVFTDGNLFTLKRNNIIVGNKVDVKDLCKDNLSLRENAENIAAFFHGRVEELGKELERRKQKA